MTSAASKLVRFPIGTGKGNEQPDLWCTYAAIRSLAWIERKQDINVPKLHAYIQSRFNRDGGYAWNKGMSSDAWATFYCTETLKDLGVPITSAESTKTWLDSLFDGRAYGMCQGQTADVWATHYAVRTLINVCDGQVKEPAALLDWLSSLQCKSGGLSWSPEFAQRNEADVRACFYGVMAWKTLCKQVGEELPWDMDRLVQWLQLQQIDEGGFSFSETALVPCLWATYRATATLAILGCSPLATRQCIDWIYSLRTSNGAFVRWQGYDCEDVWAVFCAVGSLKAMNENVSKLADSVSTFISTLSIESGGYTYRETSGASDVLSTAAVILGGELQGEAKSSAVLWIEGCQMPNEAGVMYMPGRGSEIRCTAWGLAAGAFAERPEEKLQILQWLARLQNPDGGFGFWEGRGSDMVSTASAVAVMMQIGNSQYIDQKSLERFIHSCSHVIEDVSQQSAYSNYPRAVTSFRASAQALKCLKYLGCENSAAMQELLEKHKVRHGGFANQGNRIPDLLSTYEAIATSLYYDLSVDKTHLAFFLDKVRTNEGYGWSPLFREGQDVLSCCLGNLLANLVDETATELPNLYLS